MTQHMIDHGDILSLSIETIRFAEKRMLLYNMYYVLGFIKVKNDKETTVSIINL